MHKRTIFIALAAVISILPAGTIAQQSPNLGQQPTAAQITALDISIPPDGSGLPAGTGTARAGAGIYAAKCQACHGQDGAGKPNDRLVGGEGTLTSARPVKTIGSYWPYATTLFDYIRRAMPFTQPQSLSSDETYALTAYLLYINGIIGEDDEINARTLPQVVMPNRNNFISAWPRPAQEHR